MKAGDLTSRRAVLQAIAECDALGRVPFLAEHGYGGALRYYLRHEGRLYDSKAIAGVALGYEHGLSYVRNRRGFTGGEHSVVAALQRLGFEIEDARKAPIEGRVAPKLRAGRTYSWEELGRQFGCSPDYFSVGGGMMALRKLNVLLIVTHPGGARSFDYGDYWDGDELIYTGKGLNGHQQFRAENRDAGENRRTNYVFEHAASRRLKFIGVGHCVDWELDTAPGRDGALRRIFRFRLSFDVPPRNRRPVAPAPRRPLATTRTTVGTPTYATVVRRPRRFSPDRPPSSYRRLRGPGRTPEETNALREKATAEHHRILVRLHKAMHEAGWDQIEEVPGAVDLRGIAPSGSRVLFEAKSLSGKNESGQVRGGLAQLLEYRFLHGKPSDELCLVTDGEIHPRRARLLRALEIDFVWVDNKGLHTSGTPLNSAVAGLLV